MKIARVKIAKGEIARVKITRSKKGSFFFFILFCFSLSAEGKIAQNSVTYPLSKSIHSIRIQLHNAQLKVQPLKIKLVKKKSQPTTDIKMLVLNEQKTWFSSLKQSTKNNVFILSDKKFPSPHPNNKKSTAITLSVPPLPLHILAFNGNITVQGLKPTNLLVSVPGKGDVNISNTQGKVQVFQATGKVHIESHQGLLTVQGENIQLNVQSCKGTIKVHHFKGQTHIENSRGEIFLNTFKAHDTIKHFTGKLQFYINQGFLRLKPFIGSISGKTKAAHITGGVYPKKVNIETQTGRISLDIPYSQAWVTAESWEGKIHTPHYFNRIKTGGVDRSQGRLKSTLAKYKGHVSLKSHSGSISVYQSAK